MVEEEVPEGVEAASEEDEPTTVFPSTSWQSNRHPHLHGVLQLERLLRARLL